MPITYTGSVGATIRSNMTPTPGLSNPVDDLIMTLSQAFANGSAANQASQHWSDTRTLATTSENLDLAASLTNAFGASITFATIRAIIIRNKETATGRDLKIGGAASNQCAGMFGDVSDKLIVRAGGFLVLTAPTEGYTVTAATGDILKIESVGGSVTYDIVIIGT